MLTPTMRLRISLLPISARPCTLRAGLSLAACSGDVEVDAPCVRRALTVSGGHARRRARHPGDEIMMRHRDRGPWMSNDEFDQGVGRDDYYRERDDRERHADRVRYAERGRYHHDQRSYYEPPQRRYDDRDRA